MRDLQRYLEPRPRWRAALWTTGLILLALSCFLVSRAWQDHRLAESRAHAVDRARLAAQPKPKPKPSRAELETQKRWASLQSERAFAWYPVFRALEAASNEDIELLEFVPDKPARRLVLRGEARELTALFDYVRRLSDQESFGQVHLARQKSKSLGALTTVEFEIRAIIR